MVGSDAQKYFTLQNKKGLITEGFFKITRNPNYLGEIMIYLSFGLVCQSWIAYSILFVFWFVFFTLRMVLKDYRLSSKKEFAEYSKNSYLILPKLFQSDSFNWLFYSIFALVSLVSYLVAK